MRAPSFSVDKTAGGFSLVELAIALTVIGLLLAGLVKGNELIGNSRADRVVMDFTNFQSAMENFKSTYKALPGDMYKADQRLKNCSSAPCDGNGDGNLMIGSDTPFANADYAAQSEMRAFWVQLAKSGYISGINADYTGRPNRAGVDYPATPFGGGYRVFSNSVTSAFPRIRENMIRPSRELDNRAMSLAFSAKQAGRIDRKMDDGMPETGRVLGTTTGGACNTGLNGSYPENNRAAKCNLLYVIGR